eukprot:2212594-Amphidinium_carterae.1
MGMVTQKASKRFGVRVTRRQFQRTVIMLSVQEVLTKVNAMFAQIQEECCVNTKDSVSNTDIVEKSSVGSMPKSFEIMMTWSREYGVIVIQEKDPERMSDRPRDAEIAIPRGIYSIASGRCVDNMLAMIVTLFDMVHQHMFLLAQKFRIGIGPTWISPFHHRVSRIRTHLSELITVSEGTSAFTHVDVGDFNEDNRRGRAYPPNVDTINSSEVFEDLSIMRSREPPIYPPPHPLLPWERA